jgi:hypothetical protein
VPAELPELRAEDSDLARQGPLETSEDAKERRFSRSARAEDDEHLALEDAQGQSLQSCSVAFRRRIDLENLARVDDGVHGRRYPLRVAAPTKTAARAA